MTRDQIAIEARKWIGVSFLHQGRDRAGVDCVGMLQMVGNAFGIQYDDMFGYARAPADIKFLRHLQKYLTAQPINGDKYGLIGVFRQTITPCHVGIFGRLDGELSVINSRADRREVVEERWDPKDLVLVQLLGLPGMEG